MGELILCNSGIAANSYYIEDASLNIYSLEELSYYIYNNAYLLDEGFISESLCRWIGDELKDKLLASEIRNLISDNAMLNVIIGHILRSCGYLTKKEIKSCLDIISSFEGKTEAEARKLRADHMMKDGRLADAVFFYEMILDKKLPMTDGLKGNIMHNLGCAFCGMFFFSKSMPYFEQAYRLNRNKDSLRMLLLACLFAEDEDAFGLYTNRYQVLPEETDAIKKSYNEALFSRGNEQYENVLKAKLSAAKDEVQKEFIYSDAIEDFKVGYRALRTY